MGGVISSVKAAVHEATAPTPPTNRPAATVEEAPSSPQQTHPQPQPTPEQPITTTTLPPTTIKTLPQIHPSTHICALPETFQPPHPLKGTSHFLTLTSHPKTPTSRLTCGVASLPPISGHLAPHRHPQPEIYYIISGHGILAIDGVEHDVATGTVAYIPGNAQHALRNVGAEAALRWFYCFAVDGFGEVEYRFAFEEEEGKLREGRLGVGVGV